MGGGGLHLLILAFLAVGWVVNQLFTKDEQRPTPRPGGPRPPVRPTGREPVLRWENTGESPRSPQPPPAREEILVIRNEPTRSSRPLSSAPPPTPPRRPQRVRSIPAATPRRPEPERPRTFAGDVAQSVAAAMERTKALTPLLLDQPAPTVAKAIRTPVSTVEAATTAAPSLAAALRDPNRLREAFLANVILGPPKALRHRGRA
jgi:hypothetical protein